MRLRTAALLCAVSIPTPAPAQDCAPGPTALVLSGGGAKGFAHVGVLRVLDSLGIVPDLVVGSSMGAIVGGLYAAGLSGREIDSLARTTRLPRLFTRYEPRVPESLSPLPPLVVWERGERGFSLQRAAVLEPEANALLSAGFLRGNLLARGVFDSLPVPFRAVATDLQQWLPVVLDTGDLARAVRASAAIPLLFAPERVGAVYLGDGGLSANIPVGVAREAGAVRVIVSDATESIRDSLDLDDAVVLTDRLVGQLFRQPAESLGPEDVRIRPDVDDFEALDFSPASMDQLVRNGTTAAVAALEGAACLPRRARPAGRPLDRTRLGAVEFEGARLADVLFLTRWLRLVPGQAFDPRELQARILDLGRLGRYQAVWVEPAGRLDSLTLHVTLRHPARQVYAIGAAFDNDLGGQVWLGAADRRLLGSRVEGGASLVVGSYRQELAVRLARQSPRRTAPVPAARLAARRELVRVFDRTGEEQPGVRVHEGVAWLGFDLRLGGDWSVAAGGEARAWDRPAGGDALTAGGMVMLRKGSPEEPAVRIDGALAGAYRRLVADAAASLSLGRLTVRPRVRYGSGRGLPPHLALPPGGTDGFAGYHIGEGRADEEVFAALLATYPVLGPVRLRLEPMAAVAPALARFSDDEVIWGVRAGLGVETPLGAVRAEYGVSESGRESVLVRIGRWF